MTDVPPTLKVEDDFSRIVDSFLLKNPYFRLLTRFNSKSHIAIVLCFDVKTQGCNATVSLPTSALTRLTARLKRHLAFRFLQILLIFIIGVYFWLHFNAFRASRCTGRHDPSVFCSDV